MKSALVLGASGKIGSRFVVRLAELGYDIAIHHYESSIAHLECIIAELGCKFISLKYNLSDKTSYQSILNEIAPPSLFVNCASVFYESQFLCTNCTQFDELMNLHVRSSFFLIQDILKMNAHCKIINMLDAMILKNRSKKYFMYQLAKKSLQNLSEMLREQSYYIHDVFPERIEHIYEIDALVNDTLKKVIP